jgi:hypothetical protein
VGWASVREWSSYDLSSHLRLLVLEQPIEVAGEVALEQPRGLASALALGDAAGDVVAGRRIVLAAMEHDRVQRPIELAVTAAAEPVAGGLAAGRGDRRDAREACEARFGAEPAAVWPGDEQLGSDDRPDAGLVEQRRRERADVGEDLALELVGFDGGARARRARLRNTIRLASSSAPAERVRRKRPQRSSNLPSGSRRSSSRSGSGAVTITARSCVSASRRASTALRRASSNSRNASRRSPVRGSARLSLASVARAFLAASRASSLPRSRRSLRGARLASSTHSPRARR